MSNKPRTETQKLHRKYLAECKKKGVKPFPADDVRWMDKSIKHTKATAKPAKKPCAKKPAKCECRKGKEVIVTMGDTIVFRNFPVKRLFRLALMILADCYSDIPDEMKSPNVKKH